MSLLEQLELGVWGIELALPRHFEVLSNDESAQLVDPELGVQWWLFFFEDLHLDLGAEHREVLRRGFEWPARTIFEDTHEQLGEGEPRTADASWSPIVDVEFLEIGDGDAVRTVHRMMYQPGREIIMGHVLVPLPGGLFEARAVASNGEQPTGMREAVLTASVGDDSEPNDVPVMRPQSYFDDPVHDELFGDHPLSRLRAALRGVLERIDNRVAPPRHPSGRVKLRSPKCSLVPPPGFVQRGDEMSRVTFCGTDGVQSLVVERLDARSELETLAREHATALHRASGVDDIELTLSEIELDPKRRLLIAVVDGVGEGVVRNTLAYFRAAKSAWVVAITNTRGVPAADLESELAAVAGSLEAKKRRWPF